MYRTNVIRGQKSSLINKSRSFKKYVKLRGLVTEHAN